jgi:hypothetical protein
MMIPLSDLVSLIGRLRSLGGTEEELNRDVDEVLRHARHPDPMREIFESDGADDEVARRLLGASPGEHPNPGGALEVLTDSPPLTHRSYAR